MSRQRTVNDQHFWRSPLLQACTTEDKVTLLHLLTCPDSNIIGAFPLVPRIAGAELGWTQDQWLQVIDRLRVAGLVWYDEEKMFVWVRIWWDHHSVSQVMGPKLRSRTLDDIGLLPESWREPFLHDFRKRLCEGHQAILDKALYAEQSAETSAIPSRYGIDNSSNSCPPNSTPNPNFILATTQETLSPCPVDNSGIPEAHRAEVSAALARSQQAGLARAQPQVVIDALAHKFKSTTHPPREPAALAYFLSQHLGAPPDETAISPPTAEELESLQGRCFAWPSANPANYIRVLENGEYEQFTMEVGQVVRRVGHLATGGLIAQIREKKLREVSPKILKEFARGEVA